jgi:hypothetical protein
VPGRSEYFDMIRSGFSLLVELRERRILVVIHGEGVFWLLTTLGREVPIQAQPVAVPGTVVRDIL